MRSGLRSFGAAAVLAGLLAGAPAAAQEVTVAVDGVARTVAVLERQGRTYVALDRVAELLGGQVADAGPEEARLVVDQSELLVLRRLPYVRFDGRWYQLSEAVQKDPDGFWLPASSLHHLLPLILPGRFPTGARAPAPADAAPAPAGEPPARSRPGEVDSGMIGRGELDRIDVWAGPGRTRLGFRLPRAPGVSVDDNLPGALQLRLTGVALPADAAAGLSGVGLVDSAAVSAANGGSTLTLWLAAAASVYSVAPLRSPAGFEVVLLAAPVDEAGAILAADRGRSGSRPRADRQPAPWRIDDGDRRTDRAAADPPAAAATRGNEAAPPARRETPPDRSAWKVVVDAGHGGHDPGALGPQGTREKAVTLAIARALAARLADAGVEVVLTRRDDTFVALGERTRMANQEKADLFVSIHANSAENSSAEGFETYFLSAAKTEDARRVARMENSAIRYENPSIDPESLDELNFILWDLAQNEYLRESSALAETVQEELGRRLTLRSRGVKQAPFYVLNGAFMPAILFETAFISNPREESLLNDPAFRTRLVDGLTTSVLAFLDRYSRAAPAPVAAR